MGRVAEFETELHRRAKPRFAEWHSVDLHNHTPTSDDYQHKSPDAVDRLITKINDSGLSVVMFTDHNELPKAEFTEKIAQRTNCLILRGVELNVFIDVWQKPPEKVDKHLYFHLLVGFDPTSQSPPDYWLQHIRHRCRCEEREAGGRRLFGVASPIEDIVDALDGANALLIPAHLHSTRDSFRSRSIDDIYGDGEFLRHSRDHFTALEVTSESTAAFFDGKHSETDYLHKACIRSSDSHKPDELGWRPCYVQMQHPTYAQLKAALELPFRTSLLPPSLPDSYVVGIHVQGSFLSDFWLSFSPYCNAFIGIKGAGKTSILESLRFVLGVDVPASRSQAVNDHLGAILGPGGKVTALVKRPDGAKVLIERTVADKAFVLTFEDGRQERMERPDSLHFPAYILGWHEIEQAATDTNIRRLYMDSIAGKERVRSLTERAQANAAAIRNDHERAANAYTSFRQVEQEVNRLKELRRGLQALTDANLVELKNQYQAATEHREALKAALERLRSARHNAQAHFNGALAGVDHAALQGTSPLDGPVGRSLTIIKNVIDTLKSDCASFESTLDEAVAELEKEAAKADADFHEFAEQYMVRLSSLTKEQRELLESHRRIMEETSNLPTLERERDKAKQNVESLLRGLIEHCDKVSESLDERTKLRQERVREFSEAIGSFDVRMSVVGLQPPSQFQELNQRYAEGARLWNDMRSHHSDRLGHLSLRRGYQALLDDLLSGYSLFFQHSEFGFFLSVFEDDDLQIELRVGKEGQDFRAISQLSAGQRCTAIFPILLKQQAGPLVVDQPEDNLDNRHIASSIAPVLLSDKRTRQVMFTSHNANLVVLSDPELIVTFESDGSKGRIEQQGFLATPESEITRHVLEILDGGERALELRQRKYGRNPH